MCRLKNASMCTFKTSPCVPAPRPHVSHAPKKTPNLKIMVSDQGSGCSTVQIVGARFDNALPRCFRLRVRSKNTMRTSKLRKVSVVAVVGVWDRSQPHPTDVLKGQLVHSRRGSVKLTRAWSMKRERDATWGASSAAVSGGAT